MQYIAARYNFTPPETVNLYIHTVTQSNVDAFIAHPEYGGNLNRWV